MIPGNTSSQGKKPTTPTIGTASAGNAQATVPFTESTYRGKNNAGTYRATSSPDSIAGTCAAPCSSITVTGLSNGTAYTFTVRLETPYGVNSDNSSSSNSVTPVAPPPSFGPFFPYFPPPFFPFFPYFPYFPQICGCMPGDVGTITFCSGPFIRRYSTGYYGQCNFQPPGCGCPQSCPWVEISGYDVIDPFCPG